MGGYVSGTRVAPAPAPASWPSTGSDTFASRIAGSTGASPAGTVAAALVATAQSIWWQVAVVSPGRSPSASAANATGTPGTAATFQAAGAPFHTGTAAAIESAIGRSVAKGTNSSGPRSGADVSV